MSKTVEDRLARLEDLEEIRQLFIDYGHHLDRGDTDSYASLFAKDGEVLLGPVGRAQGPTEIKALMDRALSGVTGNSYHLIANPVIDLADGGDTAAAEVSWAVIVRGESGAPALTMYGRHVDELVREDGAWRFLRREGHVDIPSAYPPGD